MSEIYIYPQGSPIQEEDYDYTSHGMVGALVPTSCVFREVANGESYIEMTHPIDEWGRYEALEKGRILHVEVPVRQTPEIDDQGNIKTRVYKYTVKDESLLPDSRRYRTIYSTRKVTTSDGTTTEEIKGKLKVLKSGTQVTVVEIPEDSIYVKVKSGGTTGWMYEESLTLDEQIVIPDSADSIRDIEPPWSVTGQLFRIYETEKTLTEVKVKARHISYDLLHNMTLYSEPKNVKLEAVLEGILHYTFDPHPFVAVTNVTTKRAGTNYKCKNPIDAFFDPEEGVCERFKVSCVRNNNVLTFLADPGINRGVRIKYGKNMTGISFKASDEDVITRIVPVGEDEDGSDLYLAGYDGEIPDDTLYYDISDYDPTLASLYNFVHVYELPYTEHKVGDLAEDGDKVYVRKTKSNSGIILATVLQGDEYDYAGEHDKSKGFYSIKITINGWVKKAHSEKITDDGEKVKITTATSVYKSADDTSTVYVDQVEVNKKYKYLDTSDDSNYYKIEIEVIGYVNDAYSKYKKSKVSKTEEDAWVLKTSSKLIADNRKVQITADGTTSIYKQASSSSTVLGEVEKDDKMPYKSQESNGFYKVDYTHTVTEKKIEILGVVYTKADIRAQMREAARQMFENDCHLPEVSLEVQFQNLGDTEEYAQFKGLEDLFLYDYCIIEYPKHNINLTARIVEIEWDCMLDRMKSIKIGSVGTTMANMTLGTWQIPNGFSGTKIGMGTLPGGAIQNGTISGLQIQDGALSVDKLIADEIEAQMLTAVRANIHDLVADTVTTDELYADLAKIGKMVVQEAEIDTAQIRELDAKIIRVNEGWIQTAHIDAAFINDATIDTAKINWASVTTADIEEANIEWASIESLEADIAHIRWAGITEADINLANINWANVTTLNATVGNIADAKIASAHITTAQIDELNAGVLEAIKVNAQYGNFDEATVKQMINAALIVTDNALMEGTVTIDNLVVTQASIISATMGELTLKSTDGKYYNVFIEPDGTIQTEEVTVSQSEINAGETRFGTHIVDTSVNVALLHGDTITGKNATIGSIFTTALDAGAITFHNLISGPAAEIPSIRTTVLSALGNSLVIRADQVLIETGSSLKELPDKLEDIDDYVSSLNTSISQVDTNWKKTVKDLQDGEIAELSRNLSVVIDPETGFLATQSREARDESGNLVSINDYIRFDTTQAANPKLLMGNRESEMYMQLTPTRLSFMRGKDHELAYFSDEKLFVNSMQAIDRLSIGKDGNGYLDMVSTATGVGFIWRAGT